MKNQFPHTADFEMLEEMMDRISAEMRKPYKKRDHDLIEALTSAVHDAVASAPPDKAAALKELAERNRETNQRHQLSRWIKPVISLAACFVVLFGLNAWTLHAYGENLLQFAYRLTESGAEVTPAELAPDEDMGSSPSDPYGIAAECEKYMPASLAPSYIPDGFELKSIDSKDKKREARVIFKFENGKQKILLNHTYFKTQETFENSKTGVNPEHFSNLSTENLHGHDILKAWEDDCFKAEFCDGRTMYDIYTINVPKEEADKILYSYFYDDGQ